MSALLCLSVGCVHFIITEHQPPFLFWSWCYLAGTVLSWHLLVLLWTQHSYSISVSSFQCHNFSWNAAWKSHTKLYVSGFKIQLLCTHVLMNVLNVKICILLPPPVLCKRNRSKSDIFIDMFVSIVLCVWIGYGGRTCITVWMPYLDFFWVHVESLHPCIDSFCACVFCICICFMHSCLVFVCTFMQHHVLGKADVIGCNRGQMLTCCLWFLLMATCNLLPLIKLPFSSFPRFCI